MKRQPEEYLLDGFPEVWRDEFEALVCYWGRVLHVMEVGAAVGTTTLDRGADDQNGAA